MALITFLVLLPLTGYKNLCHYYLIIEISLLGLTTQSSNYVCQDKNLTVQFSLSTSNHSASNPALNCSLQQCSFTSIDNQTCSLSPTPCFNYQTRNNLSYCAPAIQCSLLELCDNVTYRSNYIK